MLLLIYGPRYKHISLMERGDLYSYPSKNYKKFIVFNEEYFLAKDLADTNRCPCYNTGFGDKMITWTKVRTEVEKNRLMFALLIPLSFFLVLSSLPLHLLITVSMMYYLHRTKLTHAKHAIHCCFMYTHIFVPSILEYFPYLREKFHSLIFCHFSLL